VSSSPRRIMVIGNEFIVPPFHEKSKELRCTLESADDDSFMALLHVKVDDAVADYTLTVAQPRSYQSVRKYLSENKLPQRVLLTMVPSLDKTKYGHAHTLTITNLQEAQVVPFPGERK
jgi:hypothetical protein